MPTYDYRCNQCGRILALFYKTYKDYDAATPTCPHCDSADLTRLISRVAIQKPGRDYTSMSSDEMLSVMESGKPQEVGQMFQQLGQGEPSLGDDFHEITERLLKGDSPERIETDLQAGSTSSTTSEE